MGTTESKPLRRRQQVWVGVVAGLFVGDFVLCGYLPAQARLKSLRAARAQQERTIGIAAAQGAELPALKRRLHDLEEAVERYETRVPPEAMLGTFLQHIAGIMTTHHLADQEVVPGRAWESEGLNGIPIRITCKGTLADLFAFFNDLQVLDRLLRIEQTMLKNDSGFTGWISGQIDATIFYQSPKQRGTDGSAAVKVAGGANHGA